MVDESIAQFIKEVGFPIAAFVMMLLLYVHTTKTHDKRETEDNKRYESLVDKFIETIENLSKEQTEALNEMSLSLKQHVQQKDALIEMITDIIKERKR